MSFYFIVSTITVVILIIALVGIGIAFNTPNNAEVFPTVQNKCPDYWIIDNSGNCTIPSTTSPRGLNAPTTTISLDGEKDKKNTATPGFNGTDKINFEDSGWSTGGMSSTCKKKAWANSYGIIWDGITNYNNC